MPSLTRDKEEHLTLGRQLPTCQQTVQHRRPDSDPRASAQRSPPVDTAYWNDTAIHPDLHLTNWTLNNNSTSVIHKTGDLLFNFFLAIL